MGLIPLIRAGIIDIVDSETQATLIAGEAITAGGGVLIDPTTGRLLNCLGTTFANARCFGIASRTVPAGLPVTVVQEGVMGGFDFSACNFDDPIYLSDTEGRLQTTPGTVPFLVGRIIPMTGQPVGGNQYKVLQVDCDEAVGISPGGGVLPTTIPVHFAPSAPADRAFFIADRAYKVVGVRYVHSTAGSDAGAVNLQLNKDTGTQVPGGGVDLLTNNAGAGFDCKGVINTVQVGALSATAADLVLAAGDRLSADFNGTLTALAGVVMVTTLQPV